MISTGSVSNTIDTESVIPEKELIDYTTKLILEAHEFATLRETNETLMYTGKIYSESAADNKIKSMTEDLIKNCRTNHRLEVLNKVKAKTYVGIDEFDSDCDLITINNGMLNLKTLELENHDSRYLTKILIPVTFNKPEFDINDETVFEDIEKNLKDTLFYKYLKSSFTVDDKFRKEEFKTVLEILASFFIKRQINEKAFIFLGSGGNGKSVFLDYAKSLIGAGNTTHIPMQLLAEDKFMASNLDGKLANMFSDLENNELIHTGVLKTIISNEGIQVQRKHQQSFSLNPFCKMLFSCNRFPKVYDQSDGFFRRWIIVKWERNFKNDAECNLNLKQQLINDKEEQSKVFSSLVYLARVLDSKSDFTYKKTENEIRKEWNINADPIASFIENYTDAGNDNISKLEVHNFYKEIMYSLGETPLNMIQFGRLFSGYYDEDRIGSGKQKTMVRVWCNIKLKKPVATKIEDFSGADVNV